MEELIENVRLFPCLWNPHHSEYRETAVRDHAWDQVAQKCNNTLFKNVKTARSEWKRLRNNHREALKRAKLGQNKLLPAQITTWKYAKAMQFLEPFMKYSITEDIEMEPANTPETNFNTDHDRLSNDPGNIIKYENKNKRRCIECTIPTNKFHNVNESDALESFFECILKSTREMPPWMQTQVKKKVFAVIIEAEEQLSFQKETSKHDFLIVTKIKSEAPDND